MVEGFAAPAFGAAVRLGVFLVSSLRVFVSFAALAALSLARPASAEVIATFNGNVSPQLKDPGCVPKATRDFIDELPLAVGTLAPADCGYVDVNPPTVSWPMDDSVDMDAGWTFILLRNGVVVHTGTNKYAHYQLRTALETGRYEWYTIHRNKSGTLVKSDIRQFSVKLDAPRIPAITPEMIVQAATGRYHPRLMPIGTNKDIILSRQAKPTSLQPVTPWMTLVEKTKEMVAKPIPAAPVWKQRSDFSTQYAYQQWKLSLTQLAIAETSRIGNLGYVSMVTGDPILRANGIKRLLSLAAWDPNGPTNLQFQDQAFREVTLGLAEGFDYFYDYLGPLDRKKVVAAIKTRVTQAIPLIEFMQTHKQDSHGRTVIGFLVNILLLVAGDPDYPEAKSILHDAFNTYLVTRKGMGGPDGAALSGNSYAWYVGNALGTMTAIKFVTNYDAWNIPTYTKYVDFLMAFTAPLYSKLRSAFGDQSEIKTHYFNYSVDTIEPFALLTRNPKHEWYARVGSRYRDPTILRPIMYFNLIGMGRSPVAPEVPTGTSEFFPYGGHAVLASRMSDPLRSQLSFKSSRVGSYIHSHAEQNAITLSSKGKDLLISAGYYPYYGSPHHLKISRATRFHNAMTFDGGIGQAESVTDPTAPSAPVISTDPSGELVNGGDVDGIAIATGDATLAYRTSNDRGWSWKPLLTAAVRSVAYFRNERVTVLYDWATSNKARKWEINFHSLNPFSLSTTTGTAKTVNGDASACIKTYGLPGTMRTWTGFEIKPENGLPDQHHLRFAATTASNQLVSITVIREDCSSLPVSVSIGGAGATVRIGAHGVIFYRKRVDVIRD